jgi:lysophospholipase L1-like esterase
MKLLFGILAVAVPCLHAASGHKFLFGTRESGDGCTPISSAVNYSVARGYGFERVSRVQLVERRSRDSSRAGFATSDQPFLFSVALPEGNYNVTVTFGDAMGTSTNVVKAESRRLMLEEVRTAPGEFVTRTFTVNVRTPRISTGGDVRLKDREKSYLHWDEKLTLEFNGTRPCLAALEITPSTNIITVYLAGDSTVTDQPAEPWNSWGQMLPRFFKPGVAVANHAESGESIRSSLHARRFDKIFSTIQRRDYLFLQFGHNDMKDHATNALATYKSNLERIVDDALRCGATPVLVTSMERKAGVERDTLADYPAAVRAVAKEKGVVLIDLHAMSKVFYRALGADLGKAFQDGTHHNNYGSYELARCVAEGIRQSTLPVAKFLADDLTAFDPSKPDSLEEFRVPPSPSRDATKPDGN